MSFSRLHQYLLSCILLLQVQQPSLCYGSSMLRIKLFCLKNGEDVNFFPIDCACAVAARDEHVNFYIADTVTVTRDSFQKGMCLIYSGADFPASQSLSMTIFIKDRIFTKGNSPIFRPASSKVVLIHLKSRNYFLLTFSIQKFVSKLNSSIFK